jgi:hypothetical protein
MRYAQEKRKQKLHLVYVLPNGNLTQPICGRKMEIARMTINVPLGHSCKNCNRKINSKNFNENEFLKQYFE